MAKKSLVGDAKDTLADAARVGAEGVKAVGREALGAAAAAATGVVLKRASQALGAGQQKMDEAIPASRVPSVTRGKTRAKTRPSGRKTARAAKAKSKSSSARKTTRKAPAKKKVAKKKSTAMPRR